MKLPEGYEKDIHPIDDWFFARKTNKKLGFSVTISYEGNEEYCIYLDRDNDYASEGYNSSQLNKNDSIKLLNAIEPVFDDFTKIRMILTKL